MKPNDLFLSPSEALLTGLCLEEYLHCKKVNPDESFFSLVHSRIDPFMPDLTHIERTAISESQIPNDVSWLPIEDMQIGPSKSESNVFYGIDEQGAFRKRIIPRRNYSMLLICYLAPHLGMDEMNRRSIEIGSDPGFDMTQMAELAFNSWLESEDGNLADDGIHGEDDSPEEILKSIIDLMEYNQTTRFFDLGRSFGLLVAGMQIYREGGKPLKCVPMLIKSLSDLIHVPEIERSTVSRNVFEGIGGILSEEFNVWRPAIEVLGNILHDCQAGESVFDAMQRNSNNIDVSEQERKRMADALSADEQQARRELALPSIERMRPAVWVAFGEILGMIREIDQDAKEEDAASITPRTFGCGTQETPDKIREWLKQYEMELANGTTSKSTPEKVVNGMSGAVESLTMRLWQEDYDRQYKGSRGGFPALLTAKSRNKSPVLEKRFALIALSLYKGYRNDAAHKFDQMECGYSEARYFLSGIRTLLDLYTAITESRG